MRWACPYCPLEVEAHPNSADARAVGVFHACPSKGKRQVNLRKVDDE